MQSFIFILLLFITLFLLTRPLTVLFHELGHAIPMVLLTRQRAILYIGSYGDPNKSLKLNLGILSIFFRYNPFAWNLGLRVSTAKSVPINSQIIYTLTGPFASLTIGAVACYFTFAYDLHGFFKLFLFVFLVSALLDLVTNLIPNPTPIHLYDGSIIYNDGQSLKQLFHYKRLPKDYREALDLFNEQKYAEAAVKFEYLLKKRKDDDVYRLTIHSYLLTKNYYKAKEISDLFALNNKMNSDDLSNIALSYSELGLNEEALKLYDRSLTLNPDNKYSLNNKGYTLNLMSRFEDAIILFNKAIELDKNFAYSYNNRGLAKIKLGQTEEGLQDINHSVRLDPSNSYSYRNLGIYHFGRKEFDEALSLFTKAKELDDSTHMIDDLLNETRLKLAERLVT